MLVLVTARGQGHRVVVGDSREQCSRSAGDPPKAKPYTTRVVIVVVEKPGQAFTDRAA
ncbi:hypothetical protein VA596_31760 [Amycolatopsis sp., V23-08]|uniref:Uncharacterized protein n=1 Tax=Amycolatopsis heterodermiae TaxID=3110235 RepID=A0ABU5RD13_9PSEU|nr:hypothetical protein [Amycolatopsis sp., V23-08]MEA5364148.1 hypothetical protein [Amycolatopsis sp., V23-08]